MYFEFLDCKLVEIHCTDVFSGREKLGRCLHCAVSRKVKSKKFKLKVGPKPHICLGIYILLSWEYSKPATLKHEFHTSREAELFSKLLLPFTKWSANDWPLQGRFPKSFSYHITTSPRESNQHLGHNPACHFKWSFIFKSFPLKIRMIITIITNPQSTLRAGSVSAINLHGKSQVLLLPALPRIPLSQIDTLRQKAMKSFLQGDTNGKQSDSRVCSFIH